MRLAEKQATKAFFINQTVEMSIRLLKPVANVIQNIANRKGPKISLQDELHNKDKLATVKEIVIVFDYRSFPRFLCTSSVKAATCFMMEEHVFDEVAKNNTAHRCQCYCKMNDFIPVQYTVPSFLYKNAVDALKAKNFQTIFMNSKLPVETTT